MSHGRRNAFRRDQPVLVTCKLLPGIPNLRTRSFMQQFRSCVRSLNDSGGAQVVVYSVQSNHIHMILEAENKQALANAMKAFGSRLGKSINRFFGRTGKVFSGRYHDRVLETPRQVRNAIRYVLLNIRHHFAQRRGFPPPVALDACSSGRDFEGWRGGRRGAAPEAKCRSSEVAHPQTWLLRVGWRRHGLIDPGEVPGAA